jgi:hypothetical protein
MAKPIKETPILRGKDAVKFFQRIKESENVKISAEKLNQIKTDANKLISIAKF